MNFLDQLSDEHRRALLAIATRKPVAAGEYLVRRGDPGGDLFVVHSGRIAVVDTRTRPTTVIATMEPGNVIGEVSFLDRTPRSADVRAEEDAVVIHWRRNDVSELIGTRPELGAAFFEALCRISVRRLRNVTNHSLVRQPGAAPGVGPSLGGRAEQDALAVSAQLERTLRSVDLNLRANPGDTAARDQLFDALDATQEALTRLAAAHTTTVARDLVADTLRAELQPWLVRSFLAARSLRRVRGTTGTPDTLSHILIGSPTGDGALGELLDDWLLRRPTIQAIRDNKQLLADSVLNEMPDRRGRRVLVVNAGTGSVLARLLTGLAGERTPVTVLDPSRDALGYFDLNDLPTGTSLGAVRHDLAALANGRLRVSLPEQDVIVVDDLVCYLPDRLAMSLFRVLASRLAPGGRMYASALLPSSDDALLDLLLGWPTIRRSETASLRLAAGVALQGEVAVTPGIPTAVLKLARPEVDIEGPTAQG